MIFKAAVIAASLLFTKAAHVDEFHTSPYCWESPRVYASGEAEPTDVEITRVGRSAVVDGTVSPNGAYRFYMSPRKEDSSESWHPNLYVDNERPYVLSFAFRDTDAISAAEWISENLIYLRLWWGRAAGADFIIDVEKEAVIHQQGIRFGSIEFQQFKQCGDPSSADAEQCRCKNE